VAGRGLVPSREQRCAPDETTHLAAKDPSPGHRNRLAHECIEPLAVHPYPPGLTILTPGRWWSLRYTTPGVREVTSRSKQCVRFINGAREHRSANDNPAPALRHRIAVAMPAEELSIAKVRRPDARITNGPKSCVGSVA
jgi:hypothetical protein